MKKSLLMLLIIIVPAAMDVQARSESLSRSHLPTYWAGTLPQQTSFQLSFKDGMGLPAAVSGTLAPDFHVGVKEPGQVSGQELNVSPTERGGATERAKTKYVLNADDEEEAEDKDKEDGKGEEEDKEEGGEGWDRTWDAPKLG